MYNLILLFALPVLFVTTVAAQSQRGSACRFHFAVAEKYGQSGVWPDDAGQWWAKDGKKKFPELCESAFEDADFAIAWEKTWTRVKYYEPVWTRETQPSYQQDCVQSNDFTTVSCTTYTTYEIVDSVNFEEREREVEQLSVLINRLHADKPVRVKTIVRHGDKPGKASFQAAMKVLRNEAKKARMPAVVR